MAFLGKKLWDQLNKDRNLPIYYTTRNEILPSLTKSQYDFGTPQLIFKDVSLDIGGLSILKNISFEVLSGQINAIIGPNGAGKTSLLNCINCIYKPQRGDIVFERRSILKKKPFQIAEMGIARAFQRVELFNRMTVIENLLVGRHTNIHSGVIRCGIYYGKGSREDIINQKKVEEIIEFLEIEDFRNHVVGSLPHGIRKRVEIGRALAMNPKLLLLDEPASGMNTEETEDVARFILDIKDELEITMILVEHDMGVVMDISDRIIVIDFGEKIAEGLPDQIQKDPRVIEAYLGIKENETNV